MGDLTPGQPLPGGGRLGEGGDLTIHHIPVTEHKAPTLEQIQDFIEICKKAARKSEAVAVNCSGGSGRTGAMLAAYLVWSRWLEPESAVAEVRKARPGSVEFREQVQSVMTFHDIWTTGGGRNLRRLSSCDMRII